MRAQEPSPEGTAVGSRRLQPPDGGAHTAQSRRDGRSPQEPALRTHLPSLRDLSASGARVRRLKPPATHCAPVGSKRPNTRDLVPLFVGRCTKFPIPRHFGSCAPPEHARGPLAPHCLGAKHPGSELTSCPSQGLRADPNGRSLRCGQRVVEPERLLPPSPKRRRAAALRQAVASHERLASAEWSGMAWGLNEGQACQGGDESRNVRQPVGVRSLETAVVRVNQQAVASHERLVSPEWSGIPWGLGEEHGQARTNTDREEQRLCVSVSVRVASQLRLSAGAAWSLWSMTRAASAMRRPASEQSQRERMGLAP